MEVLIRDVAGHNWGWFSKEDQRMHIQTVERGSLEGPTRVKVWLENRGKRTFQIAEGNLSGLDAKKLKAKVEEVRGQLQDLWTFFMVNHDWLKAELRGSVITLIAYPDSHNGFERTIDLRERFPGAYRHPGLLYDQPGWEVNPPDVDFDKTLGLLTVGHAKNLDDRNHILVSDILFTD